MRGDGSGKNEEEAIVDKARREPRKEQLECRPLVLGAHQLVPSEAEGVFHRLFDTSDDFFFLLVKHWFPIESDYLVHYLNCLLVPLHVR